MTYVEKENKASFSQILVLCTDDLSRVIPEQSERENDKQQSQNQKQIFFSSIQLLNYIFCYCFPTTVSTFPNITVFKNAVPALTLRLA